MQKIRDRLVNFRVTDDEFEQLKLASSQHGARCLSAFARNTMLDATTGQSEKLPDHVVALDRRLTALEDSLSRLLHALTSSSVNSKPS